MSECVRMKRIAYEVVGREDMVHIRDPDLYSIGEIFEVASRPRKIHFSHELLRRIVLHPTDPRELIRKVY